MKNYLITSKEIIPTHLMTETYLNIGFKQFVIFNINKGPVFGWFQCKIFHFWQFDYIVKVERRLFFIMIGEQICFYEVHLVRIILQIHNIVFTPKQSSIKQCTEHFFWIFINIIISKNLNGPKSSNSLRKSVLQPIIYVSHSRNIFQDSPVFQTEVNFSSKLVNVGSK